MCGETRVCCVDTLPSLEWDSFKEEAQLTAEVTEVTYLPREVTAAYHWLYNERPSLRRKIARMEIGALVDLYHHLHPN